MNVKTEPKFAKGGISEAAPAVRYMDKTTFRAAKKRVFAKHAPLLAKLAK